MTIDSSSGVPKYHQLKEIILQGIREGKVSEGGLLPSESQLVKRFRVSRNTVRQAIEELAREGVVVRKRGKGTFYQGRPRAKTSLLGVITTLPSTYIYADIIHGIEEVLHAKAYSMILGNSSGDPAKERSLLETMVERGVEGLLIEPARSALIDRGSYIYQRLKALSIPVVLMDCVIDGLRVSAVTPADVDGGYMATEYLLEKGHRRIAIVYKIDTAAGTLRHTGYREALADWGIEPVPQYAVGVCGEGSQAGPHPAAGAVRGLLRLGDERPTAIVFFNDEWALEGLHVLLQSGVRVPEEVSIIGFDDTDYARHARVPLTSVTHPKEELGRRAAAILLEEIASGGRCQKTRIEIIPKIVERASVASAPGCPNGTGGRVAVG